MKKKIIYLTFSLLMILVGFILISPENSIGCSFLKLCTDNYIGFSVGRVLFFSFMPIAIWFFFCLFISSDRIKKSYSLFNVFFLITIVVIYILPTDCNPLSGLFCIFTRDLMGLILAFVFIIISVIKLFIKNK